MSFLFGGLQSMVLMIDNHDSFTFNIVQYLRELGARVEVVTSDISTRQVGALNPDSIVLSPGPGMPKEAGSSLDILRSFAGTIPIFGVCLGMQCVASVFGGMVVKSRRVMHGKTSPIFHRNQGVFCGLPSPFAATRYHSLVVDRSTLPETLEVTAWTEDSQEIMGLRHRELMIEGVQFHPESILSENGHQIFKNFLAFAAQHQRSKSEWR